MVGTDVDITDHKRAEEKVRSVTAQLVKAEEEERRRLSRELHDEFNQRLAMLAVDVECMTQSLPLPEAELRHRLDEMKRHVGELSEKANRLAYQLHPAVLDDLGLAAALRSYARELAKRHEFSFDVTEKGLPLRLTRSVSTCLYRVGQEALRNAAKHSQANRVTAKLEGTEGAIVLSVQDYGSGFHQDLAMKERKGLGMSTMKERVRLVGGTIEIDSSPSRGTSVRVSIPTERLP
jgi:signal transduction histidine kinase